MEQDVLQNVIDNSDFKFSRNGISVRYNQMLKQYTNQAKMYGMTLSQMAQANGMDEAGFKEYIYSSVKEAAKKEIVVKDIAAKEGLDNITDEDMEAFAQANGATKDTLVSLYGEDTVKEQVLQDKVLRFLASNADNEAENPAKLSEREVTVTETELEQRKLQQRKLPKAKQLSLRPQKQKQQRKLQRQINLTLKTNGEGGYYTCSS